MATSKRTFLLAGILALAGSVQADMIRRIGQAVPSPDGSKIAFSWQGDIWVVGRAGGRAERLTIHPANDGSPRWTPDGKRIVFTSSRFGSPDLFVMDADGNNIRRLSFDGASEISTQVSPDGQWVYGHTNAFSRQDLFKVQLSTGGDPIRLTVHPLERSYSGVVSPDGKTVAYCRGSYGTTSWQKAGMQSSALPDIWLADNTVPLSNHRVVGKTEAIEMFPQWIGNDALLFVGNRGGQSNVWRMNRDGSGAKALTHLSNGTVSSLNLSGDGKTAAFTFESDTYILDVASGATRKLEVDVAPDQRLNPVQDLSLNAGVDDYAVAPDGKRAVIVLRGDIFLIPERGGTTKRLTTNAGLDNDPVWLDAKTVLYNRAGEGAKREIYSLSIDGVAKPWMSGADDVTHPRVSPDGKSVLYQQGGSKWMLAPAAGGAGQVLIEGDFQDGLRGASPVGWSPDGKWVAVAAPTDRGTNIVLVQVSDRKQFVVARLPHDAGAPKFLPNGRGVYFTATDGEDNSLYVVDLVPNDVSFSEDDLDKIDEPRAPRPDAKVEIYMPNIENRLRRIAAKVGGDAQATADSRTIYAAVDGQLSVVSVSGGPARPVEGVSGPVGGFNLSKDGSKLYFVGAGGKLYALGLAGPPAAAPINFSAQFTVNLKEEELALFEEIGWSIDRLYYDPSHHGKDWSAIRAKFAKIVPYCYDRTDFYSLMGEMMEEMESSHLGSNAPPEPTFPGIGSDSTGFLGVDYDPAKMANGSYVVDYIYRGSAADHPASKLQKGDQIVSVDGSAVDPTSHPISAALSKKAGKKVKLTVQRGAQKLDLLIKPDPQGARQIGLYNDWVAQQRAWVDQLSGGKFAYLHIQAMDQASLDKFKREIRTLTPGKTGVIVDCRFNGGGSTAQDMLNILLKRPWMIRTTRGQYGIKLSENIYRGDALELPTITLVNQYSFSNAEVWAEGFRALGRGSIVGERTPGYVIGTGAVSLWDGGSIRLPAIGAYAMTGKEIENDGRRPDFNVWFDPNAWLQGRDLQIEKAVQELLKQAKG